MATNIELVLGLVGATIGVLICVLLPSYIFVTLSGKHTSERLFAKVGWMKSSERNENVAHSHTWSLKKKMYSSNEKDMFSLFS